MIFTSSSPTVIWVIILRRMRWVEHVVHMAGKERYICCFGGKKLRAKRPLGRARHRWEDNITKKVAGRAWTGFI
jgi:hypothetical protein